MAITNFQQLIAAARRGDPRRIVVPMGHSHDVIEGLDMAREAGLAHAILLGIPEEIHRICAELGVDAGQFEVETVTESNVAMQRAIALLHEGKADLIMKGKLNTADVLRPLLDRKNNLRTNRSISHIILYRVPWTERLTIFSDAAMNILPDLNRKVDICRNCIDVAHAIGVEHPNVAVLTALEQVNPDMPATVDAAALVQMNRRGQISGAYLEGPIQLDVPLSRFAADRKKVDSPIVEKTDILIFPNIEAANIFLRSVTYLANAEIGGLIYGTRVPVISLSRAETPQTKLNSIALSIVVSEFQQKTNPLE